MSSEKGKPKKELKHITFIGNPQKFRIVESSGNPKPKTIGDIVREQSYTDTLEDLYNAYTDLTAQFSMQQKEIEALKTQISEINQFLDDVIRKPRKPAPQPEPNQKELEEKLRLRKLVLGE